MIEDNTSAVCTMSGSSKKVNNVLASIMSLEVRFINEKVNTCRARAKPHLLFFSRILHKDYEKLEKIKKNS